MTAFAGALVWLGYWVGGWGWTQLRGCNAGFLDFGLVGRNPTCNPDKQLSANQQYSASLRKRKKNAGQLGCPKTCYPTISPNGKDIECRDVSTGELCGQAQKGKGPGGGEV